MMKRCLQLYFTMVIVILTITTVAACCYGAHGKMENVFDGYREVGASLWGKATLLDAYFAFGVFWLWVCYKEFHWTRRVLWLLLIASLGNFAISAYMLIELFRLKQGEGFAELLVRKY